MRYVAHAGHCSECVSAAHYRMPSFEAITLQIISATESQIKTTITMTTNGRDVGRARGTSDAFVWGALKGLPSISISLNRSHADRFHSIAEVFNVRGTIAPPTVAISPAVHTPGARFRFADDLVNLDGSHTYLDRL